MEWIKGEYFFLLSRGTEKFDFFVFFGASNEWRERFWLDERNDAFQSEPIWASYIEEDDDNIDEAIWKYKKFRQVYPSIRGGIKRYSI